MCSQTQNQKFEIMQANKAEALSRKKLKLDTSKEGNCTKQIMVNPSQLESIDRPLNESRFNGYFKLVTGQHYRWIKCGKLYNGGDPAH